MAGSEASPPVTIRPLRGKTTARKRERRSPIEQHRHGSWDKYTSMSVQRYPPSVRGRMRDVHFDVDALLCAVVSLVFWYFSGTGAGESSAAAGASVWYRK